MFKRFATRELIFIALISAAMFVTTFLIGSGVVAATGVPLTNDIVTGIILAMFEVILIRTVPKFGTFTLAFTIYSILELPTALGGGPGFWPKIPINVITGLIADIFLHYTKYKTWSYFVGWYVISTVNFAGFVLFLILLGMPGVKEMLSIIHWIILAFWVCGTIGILLGIQIYNKLKDKMIFKRFRS